MKWIKNLKITQKFTLLLAVTLVSLLIIGSFSFFQLTKVGNKLEDMYDNKLLPIETLSTINNNFQFVRLAQIELMINTDQARNDELLASIDKRLTVNGQLLGGYTTDDPEELELLEKLAITANEFEGHQAKMLDLALNNKNNEAYELYVAKGAPLLNTLDDIFTELIAINSNDAQTVHKENEQDFHSAIILLTSISALAVIIYIIFSWVIVNLIYKPVKEMETLMKKAESGDLNIQSKYESKDEIGILSQFFNKMLHHFRSLIMNVHESSDQVAASSEQLMASADETNKASEHIAEASTSLAAGAEVSVIETEKVAVSMQEMATGISNITQSINLVSKHSHTTSEESQKGNIALTKTINQMNSINETVLSSSIIIKELGSRSTEIEKIVAVISGIAEQTNLLALNASIEAARAGEHGKGFAVVANEVKKLAEESRRSAENITHLIHEIQGNTMNAVSSMEACTTEVKDGLQLITETGNSFKKILHSAADVSTQSQEVAEAAEQISTSVEQMTMSILDTSKKAEEASLNSQNVAAGAEEQLASMEEITASAHALARMADDLRKMVSIFKI